MFRIVFHPMTNQMVWAHPDDLARRHRRAQHRPHRRHAGPNVRTFRTFEFFAIAAVIYYLIAKLVTLGARLIAWRLFRY